MAALPTEEWTNALDRMSAALEEALADQDRYTAEWSPLTDTLATATPPDLLHAWLERRLDQWDARLRAAAELAASVEMQLEERETALGQWHDLFVRWHDLIQRGVATTSTSSG